MNRTAVLDDRAALSRGHPLQSSTSSLSSVTGTLHDTISRPLAQWITAALTSSGLQHHLENAGSMDADSLIGTLATGELLCFAAKLEFHSRPSLYSQISNLSLLLHFCESNDIRTGWSPQQVVQGRQRLAFLATVFQLAHTLHEQEPTTLPPPPISPPPTLHDLQRAHSLPMCPGSDLPPRTDSVLLQSRSIDNSHVDLAPLVARVASLEQAQFQLIAAFQTADQSARASHAAVEKLTTALIDAFVDIQLLVSRQSDGGDSAIASNASLVPAARSTEPGFDAPSAASASSMALPTLVAPPLEAVAIPERGVTAMPQLDINVPVSALFDSDDYGLSTVTTAMAATPPPAQPTTAAAAASAQAAAATSLGHALAQLEAACLPPVTALDEDSMPMHTVLEQGSSSSNNNNKNTAAPQLNGRMRALSIASLPSMWSNATSADVETIATDKKSFFTTATQRSRRASPAAYDATSLADDSRSVYSLNSVGTARRSSVPAISSSRPASVRFGSTAPRPSGTSSSRVSVGSTDLAQLKAELHARLPESVLDAVSTKIELLRQAAIYELITTERSFANDLKVLWTDLCQWLQRAASNTGDTSEELRKIVVAVFPTSESVEHVLGCSALVMTSHQEILDVIQRELAQSRTGIIDSPERLLLQMR
ncbi:hypothetical protein BC828DRAFT_268512 [Blastocladiella britannica]|nr:hypothetical protein BC828DRAFT_268512 [Blastocladiella britannica]